MASFFPCFSYPKRYYEIDNLIVLHWIFDVHLQIASLRPKERTENSARLAISWLKRALLACLSVGSGEPEDGTMWQRPFLLRYKILNESKGKRMKQKIVLWCGSAIIIVMCLFPPMLQKDLTVSWAGRPTMDWRDAGYHFLTTDGMIKTSQLVVQCVIVAIITGVVCFSLASKGNTAKMWPFKKKKYFASEFLINKNDKVAFDLTKDEDREVQKLFDMLKKQGAYIKSEVTEEYQQGMTSHGLFNYAMSQLTLWEQESDKSSKKGIADKAARSIMKAYSYYQLPIYFFDLAYFVKLMGKHDLAKDISTKFINYQKSFSPTAIGQTIMSAQRRNIQAAIKDAETIIRNDL